MGSNPLSPDNETTKNKEKHKCIAQSVEQRTFNPFVLSSSLSTLNLYNIDGPFRLSVRTVPFHGEKASSILARDNDYYFIYTF